MGSRLLIIGAGEIKAAIDYVRSIAICMLVTDFLLMSPFRVLGDLALLPVPMSPLHNLSLT